MMPLSLFFLVKSRELVVLFSDDGKTAPSVLYIPETEEIFFFSSVFLLGVLVIYGAVFTITNLFNLYFVLYYSSARLVRFEVMRTVLLYLTSAVLAGFFLTGACIYSLHEVSLACDQYMVEPAHRPDYHWAEDEYFKRISAARAEALEENRFPMKEHWDAVDLHKLESQVRYEIEKEKPREVATSFNIIGFLFLVGTITGGVLTVLVLCSKG